MFKLAFVVIAVIIGAKFLFATDNWRLGDKLPGRLLMILYGFIIGLYSALLGVGGGSVATAILTLYGQPIHVAVGLSAGIGVIISTVGTIGFILAGLPHQAMLPPLSIGFVSLLGFVLMAPVSALTAPLGRAHRARSAAPQTRNRVRDFPVADRGAVCVQPRWLGIVLYG